MLYTSAIAALAAAVATPPATGPVEYNRDVRPILSANCFPCHGSDSAARKDDLRLDQFEAAVLPREESRPAIVPGKPADSELVARIESKDDPMPPPKSHKTLTAAQKQVLRRWVAEGAQYQPHWSFIPPARPALPEVRTPAWIKNPIDRFVLAALDKQGLAPAPEADRRTLIRRLSLDLTGLPPVPADVERFVADQSPGAYEKLVDRLLLSRRFGEHRARYWLDAARYADTHGIHFDNYREIWAYREWVIKAFNRNLPFDQFTVEQLAGDLLPGASMEQQIASGFNRQNITTNEGGAIDEEYLVLYARDRTETASQVWLGLTTGCAVCHDHKYDPFSQKDFYSLSAFFNNGAQKAMDGNVKDTPPILTVPTRDDRAQWEIVSTKMTTARKQIARRMTDGESAFATWLRQPPMAKQLPAVPAEDLVMSMPLSEGTPRGLSAVVAGTVRPLEMASDIKWQPGAISERAFTVNADTTPELDDVGDFERDQPFSYAAWVKLANSKEGAILSRMDDEHGYRGWDMWLEKGRPGAHIVHKLPDDAFKVVARNALPSKRWSHVCVTYDGSSRISGLKIYVDGEVQDLEVQSDSLSGSIRTPVSFKIGQRHKSSPVEDTGVQDVRIYGRALAAEDVQRLANGPRMAYLTSRPTTPAPPKTAAVDSKELYNRWLVMFDRDYRGAQDELRLLNTFESLIRSRGTVAHVMTEREAPAEAFVLQRGEYDKRGDRVTPATPAALPAMTSELPRNRLGLARWLLSPANPLPARVTVNRFWQELFGAGIVQSTGDFGVSGETPSHPELLDWLAVEFRESGWDIKKFFKLLTMSATYRQAAVTTPAKLARDPQNLLLSRGPRFRMDAEMVRDYALAASGLLVDKIGGPSVKPYQPDGVWEAVAMPNSNTAKYRREQGESLYRRSLYTFWKRSAPPASMEIFNAPSREVCSVRRDRTNTPLQALTTLNDEQFVEAARVLAELAIKDKTSDAARIDFIARRVLARPLEPAEAKIALGTLRSLVRHYKAQPDAAALLVGVGDTPVDGVLDRSAVAAFTLLASNFLNLDEALNK